MKKMLFILLALLSFSFSAFAALNLNTATQAELEALKGIGPVKAKAIIDYRQKNGGFKSVDELEKVQGIGAGILKKVRAEVSISGKTTAPAAAAPVVAKASKESEASLKEVKDTKKTSKESETKSKEVKDTKKVNKESEASPKEVKDTKKTSKKTEAKSKEVEDIKAKAK